MTRFASASLRVAVVAAIVALAALSGAVAARADGDPASDVLLSGPLFQPIDLQLSDSAEAQLAGLLDAAGRRGFPLRVALIASQGDLGTVTQLWQQPAIYAHYLDTELSLDYSGQVLVVMPDGYGLWGAAPPRELAAERAVLLPRPAPGDGAALAAGANTTIRLLAAAAGHPLPAVVASAPSGPGASAASSVLPWIVFVAGLIAVGLAWGASLSARPLSLGRKVPS